MQKKYSVPMALGRRAHFTLRGSDRDVGWLELTKLDVTEGVLTWEMRSSKGHVLAGNAYAEVNNPLLGDKFWVKPKIPITMHLTSGVCFIEMIFLLPGAAFIKVLRQ